MKKNTTESSTLFTYENTDIHESQNILTQNTPWSKDLVWRVDLYHPIE